MAEIVIIDDDELFTEMLTMVMDLHGHESRVAHTLNTGRALLETDPADVVFLDMRLPDGNGLDLLPWLCSRPNAADVIMITALGDPESAEKAIINGAWDYLEKPSSMEQMAATLERILQGRRRRERVNELDTAGLVGKSPQFLACLDQLAEAASTEANVLITGETGTGKELFARAIHRNSRRTAKPFVTVDCASLSPALLESELFGFRRGSFTGAVGSRIGLIGQSDGGTLFLDEVGELPLSQQKAFLRVLQERKYRPVGSDEEVASDFRLVGATNRNLEELSKSGVFREDLLFRIQAMTIVLPPLRERVGDLRELLDFHMRRICARDKYPEKAISPEVYQAFGTYSWPGNMRELVNVLERIVHSARDETQLLPEHLPRSFRAFVAKSRIGGQTETAASFTLPAAQPEPKNSPAPVGPPDERLPTVVEALPFLPKIEQPAAVPAVRGAPVPRGGTWREYRKNVLDEAERAYLNWLLRSSQGDIRRAADIARLSLPRIYALLRKHRMVRQWSDAVE